MTTETAYVCWQCGTLIDQPCSPDRGGYTCECGNSYHNPNVRPQTAIEFFDRLAKLGERGSRFRHDIDVGDGLVRVVRLAGSSRVYLRVRAHGWAVAVGLSFEQVDELCEALAAAAPVPYVPRLPEVSVVVAPRR